jgi:isopentenyldiphosphate isomerase
MASNDLLDIVDENDSVIGPDTRENVHKKGLLHREIHIWFITPDGDMIFQHRAKDKDTYPDLLDATVGGHVDLGMSYEDTAIKEMKEETGIAATIGDLHLIKKLRTHSIDSVTGKINDVFRVQYGYVYKGNIFDLKIEAGKAVGFVAWPIEKIFSLTEEDKKLFIPLNYSKEFLDLFKDLQKLIKK